jgi:hypothetical protein
MIVVITIFRYSECLLHAMPGGSLPGPFYVIIMEGCRTENKCRFEKVAVMKPKFILSILVITAVVVNVTFCLNEAEPAPRRSK